MPLTYACLAIIWIIYCTNLYNIVLLLYLLIAKSDYLDIFDGVIDWLITVLMFHGIYFMDFQIQGKRTGPIEHSLNSVILIYWDRCSLNKLWQATAPGSRVIPLGTFSWLLTNKLWLNPYILFDLHSVNYFLSLVFREPRPGI